MTVSAPINSVMDEHNVLTVAMKSPCGVLVSDDVIMMSSIRILLLLLEVLHSLSGMYVLQFVFRVHTYLNDVMMM